MSYVLETNEGLKTSCCFNRFTADNTEDRVAARALIQEPISSEELTYFKFAPTTSCSVERSFSVYKTLLNPNRQSFEFHNIRKVFVARCNAQVIFALRHAA